MGTRKYTHNTEIECTLPPFFLSYYLLPTADDRGYLVVQKNFFLSSNQKLISTEISDEQTSQTEAEFVTCSKFLGKSNVE